MSNTGNSNSSENKKAILVVGDWVIDEYWFLVEHQSEKSTHTGLSHYRISSRNDDAIADLCGAGHAARVLYDYNRENSRYKICGIGHWNDEDTQLIRHLFHRGQYAECQPVAPPFRLTTRICTNDVEDVYLDTISPDSPTIRIIRQYHQRENGLVQINRIDWEPQQTRSAGNESRIDSIISRLKNECVIEDIIIYDLVKGVINEELVQKLADEIKSARWYIFSKAHKPKWLKCIGKDNIQLILIRPELTATLKPWDNWLIGGNVSDRAMEAIEEYDECKARHVVLLSEQREIVACLNNKKDCITAKTTEKPNELHQLGWCSAFMASMVDTIATLKPSKKRLDEEDIGKIMEKADNYGYINAPNRTGSRDNTEITQTSVYCSSRWQNEQENWEKAKQGIGIIEEVNRDKETGYHLDVWRGATELPEYIAIVDEKRETIAEIGHRLKAFKKQSSPSRPLSILLQGDPGSGKTYLARCLAKTFGFSYLGYNITQMLHKEELLNLFETVATRQTSGGDALLVFVDEINAFIDNSSVYGAFLSPLEEGRYVRFGNAFSLKPCIWIFAGTNIRDNQRQDAQKLSDFESRITLKSYLDYDSIFEKVSGDESGKKRLEEQAKLEQVYIGALSIRSYFPDVQRVSRDTLDFFYNFDPSRSPIREISKFVSSMKNVQYGEITGNNWKVDGKNIEKNPEMISLHFKPDSRNE